MNDILRTGALGCRRQEVGQWTQDLADTLSGEGGAWPASLDSPECCYTRFSQCCLRKQNLYQLPQSGGLQAKISPDSRSVNILHCVHQRCKNTMIKTYTEKIPITKFAKLIQKWNNICHLFDSPT